MGITLGSLEFYTGPTVLGGPDDLDEVIRGFIDGARHSLFIAVQELDSEPIGRAILAAARERGVRVQLILEGDYLRETDEPVVDPWQPDGRNETNRTIHAALLRSGLDVVSDLNPKIFHQKFVVRDPGESSAAVLTGSTNFTCTDTGINTVTRPAGARGNNLNHVLVMHGESAAGQYLREFMRMRSGTFGDLHERIEPKPREFNLGRVRVKPLFAPRHGPEMEIMKQMLKAEHSVDFAMYTFSHTSGIDDTMLRLAPSVKRIRGVMDRGQGIRTWAPTKQLKAAGVELHMNRRDAPVRKIHHKLMVIDARLVIVGSFNYTAPANTVNDENIIVLGDLEEKNKAAEKAQRQLAAYALAEIDRIIADFAEKV